MRCFFAVRGAATAIFVVDDAGLADRLGMPRLA
jgi:hypothetical protein